MGVVWSGSMTVDVVDLLHVDIPPLTVSLPTSQAVGPGTVWFHDAAPAGVYRLRREGPDPLIDVRFGWPGGDSFDPALDITHPGGPASVPIAVKTIAAGVPAGPYSIALVVELL